MSVWFWVVPVTVLLRSLAVSTVTVDLSVLLWSRSGPLMILLWSLAVAGISVTVPVVRGWFSYGPLVVSDCGHRHHGAVVLLWSLTVAISRLKGGTSYHSH